jgi:hypothetical protein
MLAGAPSLAIRLTVGNHAERDLPLRGALREAIVTHPFWKITLFNLCAKGNLFLNSEDANTVIAS